MYPVPSIAQFHNLRSVTLLGNLFGSRLDALRGSRVQTLSLSGCEGINKPLLLSLEGSSVTDLDISQSYSVENVENSHSRVDDTCIFTLSRLGLPLTRLNLSRTSVTDHGLTLLQTFSELRALVLQDFDWKLVTVVGLNTVKKLPLTSLALSAYHDREYKRGHTVPRKFVKFDKVKLTGMQLIDLSIDGACVSYSDRGLARLLGMPLVNLEARNCAFLTDAGMEGLRGMHSLEKLVLEVPSPSFPISPFERYGFNISLAGWEVLRGMSSLKSLHLEGAMSITDASLEVLKGLPLVHLHLDSHSPGHVFAKTSCVPSIEDNTLSDTFIDKCHISDLGLSYFKNMPLMYLHVKSAEITDQGMATLSGLPLTYLYIWSTAPITDQGILRGLRGMYTLAHLFLSDVSQVSNVGIQVLLGKPLTSLTLQNCSLIADASFGIFKSLPLAVLHLEKCPLVTNSGLVALSGCTVEDLKLTGFVLVSWVGLLSLRTLPLSALCVKYYRRPIPQLEALGRGYGRISTWNLTSLREAMWGEKLDFDDDYYP